MKCPILTAGFWADPTVEGAQAIYCLREECAWWDEGKLCCGDRTEWKQLERIADILREIVEKMPHVGQFKK